MALDPDSFDRIRALYKRFDQFPEAKFTGDGALLRREAYNAFLDLRQEIPALLTALQLEVGHWRPIATFFEAEPETNLVLLWEPREPEGVICLGYWDDDAHDWYRDGEGADLESSPMNPTKWMPLAGLMRSADDREFVAIPRLAG